MKKVLIQAPEETIQIFACFPFLAALKEWDSSVDIHVLADKEHVDLFRLLPFKVKAFAYDPNEKGVFGVHHFAKNLHDIFNIDAYFDFGKGMKSAFLGKSFSAKERIGWKEGMNKLLLTHSYEKPGHLRDDALYMKLLENYTGKNFSNILLNHGGLDKEEIENFFNAKSPEPFLLYLFGRTDEDFESYEKSLRILREAPQDKKVVALFHKAHKHQNEIKKEFAEQSNLSLGMIEDLEILPKYFEFSQGVLTDTPWLSRLSSLYGMNTFLFVDSFRELPFWAHYKHNPFLLEQKDGKVTKALLGEEERLVEEEITYLDIVFDKLGL